MAKSNEKAMKKKIDLITLISTILIVFISITSVASVFLLSSHQSEGRKNLEISEKYNDLSVAIENDIEYIIGQDTPLQDVALIYLQDFLMLNYTLGGMKQYNQTHPFTFMQPEIDAVAIQAALQIKRITALINQTIAYEYAVLYWGSYSIQIWMDFETYEYVLLKDLWGQYNTSLDSDLMNWIDTIIGPNPEILEINLLNWESYMYNDTTVIRWYGKYANDYLANNYDIDQIVNLESESYYNLLVQGDLHKSIGETYNQAANQMGTSLILFAISAVVIAFATQIRGKKYIWISLIIGGVVTAIGLWIFFSGIQYAALAKALSPYWEVWY